MTPTGIMQSDARDIARMISIPQLLRHLGWHVWHRNRADCGLCRGSSRGTVAYREHVWHCHRCQAGGGVYQLIMLTHACNFREAMHYLADLAGVQIKGDREDTWRLKAIERRRHCERVGAAGDKLATVEGSLRLECRDQIHHCDRILDVPGPWDESQWQQARAAYILRNEFLLPEYTLLSFGTAEARAKYVLAENRLRAKMASAIRVASGVQTDDGHFMAVIGT